VRRLPTARWSGPLRPETHWSRRGLVGWWKHDEQGGRTLRDDSGHGHDASLIGVSSPGFLPGRVGWSYDYDGIDDRGEVPDNPRLSITGALTISMWIYVRGQDATRHRAMLGKYRNMSGATNQRAYECYVQDSGDAVDGLGMTLSDTGTFKSDGALETGPNVIERDRWQHAAFTFEPGERQRIWVNGEVVAEKTANVLAEIADTPAPLWLGVSFDTGKPGNHFWGRLDDVRLYERALSPWEIRQLYERPESLYAPQLLDAWRPTGQDVDATWSVQAVAAWAGAGSVELSPNQQVEGTATFVSDAILTLGGSIAMPGEAAIALSTIIDLAVNASLGGVAFATLVPSVLLPASASFAAASGLLMGAEVSRDASTAMLGEVLVSADPEVLLGAGVSVVGLALLDVTTEIDRPVEMAVSGSAVVVATGVVDLWAGVSMAGMASWSATAETGTGHEGAVAMAGAATFSAEVVVERAASMEMEGTAVFESVTSVTRDVTMVTVALASMSAEGTASLGARMGFEAVAEVSLGSSVEFRAAAVIVATGSLTGAASIDAVGSSSMSGVATMGAAPLVIRSVAAAMTGRTTMGLDPDVTKGAEIGMVGVGSLEAGAEADLSAAWSSIGAGSLSSTASLMVFVGLQVLYVERLLTGPRVVVDGAEAGPRVAAERVSLRPRTRIDDFSTEGT